MKHAITFTIEEVNVFALFFINSAGSMVQLGVSYKKNAHVITEFARNGTKKKCQVFMKCLVPN